MFLVIFTTSYPYDSTSEYALIGPEIRRLAASFEKIVVVPRTQGGKMLALPPGVEVNERYADFLRTNKNPVKTLRMAISSDWFSSEIRSHPSILLYPAKMLKLIQFLSKVELTRQWITRLIDTQSIDIENTVLYSYWFNHTATGCARIKQQFPAAKFVSRAHGYDIYEEYYYPYYWPCRQQTLELLDILFLASDAGRDYFCKRYPEYQSKFETRHLGIEDPGSLAKSSGDGIFRIVTCSYIWPVKRLPLFLDGLIKAARVRPNQKFEWTHFGDGKGRKSLQKRMHRQLPLNVQCQLMGQVSNQTVLEHYKNHPVDVFVNVSKTEGGAPVSIQEAMSCGVPVVATAVGGNPEIVSERNGILLNPNPTTDEIASALLKIWDNPALAASMRMQSRQVWQTSYNAEANFRAFAERLQSIGER